MRRKESKERRNGELKERERDALRLRHAYLKFATETSARFLERDTKRKIRRKKKKREKEKQKH